MKDKNLSVAVLHCYGVLLKAAPGTTEAEREQYLSRMIRIFAAAGKTAPAELIKSAGYDDFREMFYNIDASYKKWMMKQ